MLLHPEMNVRSDDISEAEVVHAGRKLKRDRASGVDGIPAEFWKSIACHGSPALQWVLDLCRECWRQKRVPDVWHDARVAMLYKKGDPAECSNYRPISLLCICYKMLAIILLERLQEAGAEQLLWRTQFGFRKGRGTQDALFIARRAIEQSWELKDGRAVLLALDWAKAFDSISPQSLMGALGRFGIPKPMVDMITAIYSDRRFYVRDFGTKSEWRRQHLGICQGCPLSPFLFIIVMTVLMNDAKHKLDQDPRYTGSCFESELVYADDTLILAIDDEGAQAYMEKIAEAGNDYGLSFNWSKLEVLPVRTTGNITKPDQTKVDKKSSIVYLGSSLAADGRVSAEIGRRLGMAKKDFETLRRVWAHSRLSLQWKLQVFGVCIATRLVYGLTVACLNQVERRRLDGFQARCLRRVLGIQAAYYSRVSNASVLAQAGQLPLSQQLLRHQMIYMGNVARRPDHDPVRSSIFQEGTIHLRPLSGMRRVGRPRLKWASTVFDACVKTAGSHEQLKKYFEPGIGAGCSWRALICRYT